MTKFHAELRALLLLSQSLRVAHDQARAIGITDLADSLFDQGRAISAMIGQHVVAHGTRAAVEVVS